MMWHCVGYLGQQWVCAPYERLLRVMNTAQFDHQKAFDVAKLVTASIWMRMAYHISNSIGSCLLCLSGSLPGWYTVKQEL